jgi:hypothetical protein
MPHAAPNFRLRLEQTVAATQIVSAGYQSCGSNVCAIVCQTARSRAATNLCEKSERAQYVFRPSAAEITPFYRHAIVLWLLVSLVRFGALTLFGLERLSVNLPREEV